MPLTAGTRLGPYEIVAPLGAGGMGEVYRSKDTRLDRIVAVKVLSDALASDPMFRERFDREARAISSLEHPHICPLYDVGHQDGTSYLVMQYLEGETLADRIAKGPIPIDQSFTIAIQIADALTCAHRAGITHRDLKPGNVMLTKSGAKLLDFGLAKTSPAKAGHYVQHDAQQHATALPTMGAPLTAHGTILGTFQYMAPEQLEGADADTRSDIWGLGAVLYETLTGRKAFEGKSQASLIGAIMTSEPPAVSALQPVAPAALDRIVRKCLAKDPDARWQSARDLHDELQWIAREGQAASTSQSQARPTTEKPAATPRVGLWKVATAVLAVSALALASVMFSWRLGPVTPAPVTRLQVTLPENISFSSTGIFFNGANGGSISPDGTRLAFTATDDSGRTLIWIRPLNSFSAQSIAGTDGASVPFWSADSRFLGFFTVGKLKRVDAAGGPAQTIADLAATSGGSTGTGGAWSSSRRTILFASTNSAIFQVPADGGQAKAVTRMDEKRSEVAHRWPFFLPDEQRFLYFIQSPSPDVQGVYVRSLDADDSKRLIASDTNAVYAAGMLLFVREGTLFRQAFDLERLEVTGEATPIAERVATGGALGAFSASTNGTLTYRSGGSPVTQFAWVDRTGRVLETVGPPGDYAYPVLSPDQQRLAFSRYDNQPAGDIWLLDMTRRTTSRFTFGAGAETYPIWSPDGQTLLYVSTQPDSSGVFEKSVVGSAGERQVVKGLGLVANDISSDGRHLLYFVGAAAGSQTGLDIFALPLTGDPKPIPVVQSPFTDAETHFSPDGRWIAYASNETGRFEVFVQPFPTSGAKWQVSTTGGRQPMWRSDGRELYFVNDERKFYAVDIRAGSAFEFGTPQFLFDMRANVNATRNSYVPSRDGRRFLVNMALDSTRSPINVVTNWTAEVK